MKRDCVRIFAGVSVASAAVGWLAFSAGASAPAGRYTLGTETVVDTVTHLTWQRVAPTSTYAWADAKAYCAGLSLGGVAAGGWRLPRVLELLSIVDEGAVAPNLAIDATAFPNMPNPPWFWSSSPFVRYPGEAWYVDFDSGKNVGSDPSASSSVRCVR
jgi:hypothetical protein